MSELAKILTTSGPECSAKFLFISSSSPNPVNERCAYTEKTIEPKTITLHLGKVAVFLGKSKHP